MAINQFVEQQYTNLGGVTTLYGRGTGAGASTLTGVKGPWVITRTGTGAYTITLNRKYAGLLDFTGTVIDVTTPDDWEVFLAADLASNNAVSFLVFKGGVAADLSTDEKILLRVVLQDTQAKPAGF